MRDDATLPKVKGLDRILFGSPADRHSFPIKDYLEIFIPERKNGQPLPLVEARDTVVEKVKITILS